MGRSYRSVVDQLRTIGLELKTHRSHEVADDRPVNIDVATRLQKTGALAGTVRTVMRFSPL